MKIKLLIFLSLLCSCSNSVSKVLRNPEKLQAVGQVWQQQHPCINDTTLVGFDTFFVAVNLDTLKDLPLILRSRPCFTITDFPRELPDTLYLGTKIITRKMYITDVRKINILKDTIDNLRLQVKKITVSNAEALKKYKDIVDQSNDLRQTAIWFFINLWRRFRWWLLIVIAILLVYRFRKLIFKIL